jgi:hypothetical protein
MEDFCGAINSFEPRHFTSVIAAKGGGEALLRTWKRGLRGDLWWVGGLV